MFSRISRCSFRVINSTFVKPAKMCSDSVWYLEKKSQYKDEHKHSWHLDSSRHVFWGTLAAFSALLTMKKNGAFCAYDDINGKNECSSSARDTRPTRSVIRKESKVEETSDGGYLRKSLQELGVSGSMNYLLNEVQRYSQQKQLLMKNDRHFVVIRPKAYVDSSGNTWANGTERLRLLYPDDSEAIDLGNSYSKCFHSLCAAVHDDIFLSVDMSEDGDILKVTKDDNCKHHSYGMKRLQHLIRRGEISELEWNVNCHHCTEFEKTQGNELIKEQKYLLATAMAIMSPKSFGKSLWEDFLNDILREAKFVLEHIIELKLPPVKPNWADLTDAGLGVGVSNFEVKFRDAEFARIHPSDYHIRVHCSHGDSGQNEAERTNSAIGDSVVDGSTIDWNFYE